MSPDLRPRTVGELLDAAFFVYRRHFGRLLLVATIVSVPTLIAAGLAAEESAEVLRDYWYETLDAMQPQSKDPLRDILDSFERSQRINTIAFLSALLQSLARGGGMATMALVAWAAVHRDNLPGPFTLVRRALPRTPAVVISQIGMSMMWLMIGCCFPVSVPLGAILTPVPAVIMLERGALETELRGYLDGDEASGKPAAPFLLGWPLRLLVMPIAMLVDGTIRSVRLSWHAGTIARGSAFISFLWLFVGFFVSGVSVGAGWAVQSFPVVFWLQHYAEVIFLPIAGLAVAFWYLDVRVRREGLDLVAAPEPAA